MVGDAPIFGMHYSLAKGGSVSVGDKVLFVFGSIAMVDVVFNVSSPNFETTIYTIWSEICVEFFQNNENKERQNSQQS